MISFLKPEDIARWGLKAASLRFLCDAGLYTIPVSFFDSFTTKEQIMRQLKHDGLTETGWGMSVRFSNRTSALYQPHRWALRTYSAVAEYIESNRSLLQDGTFVVFNTDVPAYMGNILKRRDGTYRVEMVPGTWITSGVEPTDYGEIEGSTMRLFVYQQPRRVLGKLAQDEQGEVIMGQFVPRVDPPLSHGLAQTLSERVVAAAKKLTELQAPPLMYEFNMNNDLVLHIREIKEIDEDALITAVKHSGTVYEIDQYHKLKDWDGTTSLYITVGVEKSNADKFQEFIKAIQGRVEQVYVKYGMLTHPAILLREAGIQPISLRQQYKEYTFTFPD